MNEPQPGTHTDQVSFSSEYLYPLYSRVIQAITGVRDGLPDCPKSNPFGKDCAYPNLGINDQRHSFFFEPTSVRNLVDYSPQNSTSFTTYKNIVYAPHVYTHVFTIDAILHLNESEYPPSFEYVILQRTVVSYIFIDSQQTEYETKFMRERDSISFSYTIHYDPTKT